VVGIVRERLAQDCHRDVDASIEFDHGIVRPKNLAYFLAGNDLALPLDQDSQDLEGLLTEQNLRRPSFSGSRSNREKFCSSDVELEFSEANMLGLISRLIHGLSAQLPGAITPRSRLTHSATGK
jgi:hypothetical protein